MSSAPDGQHGIFLGNLDDGKTKKEVATMISRLIIEAAGFIVEARAVTVRKSRNSKCFTAWFYLDSHNGQQRAFRALKNYSSVPDGLVKSGRKLKVDVYKSKIIALQLPNNPTNLDTNEAFSNDQLSDTSSVASNYGAVSTPNGRSAWASGVGVSSPDSMVTSNATPEVRGVGITKADPFSPVMISQSAASLGATSFGVTSPGAASSVLTPTGPVRNGSVKPQKVYTQGEELQGTETRILEFKRAGGNLQHCLKKHLARYVCAFLNSEGGTLMLGVDDSGCVCGVWCDRKLEDATRLSIDQTMQRFEPTVLPQLYQVQFVPVRNHDGIQPNLKVIEVSVEQGREDFLYETPNTEVFIKRDGSVKGPLRPKDIQEWCRLKFNSKPINTDETNLKVQVNNLQERLQKLESNQQENGTKYHKDVKESNSEHSAKDQNNVKKSNSDEDSVKNHKDIKKTSSAVCTIL